MNLNKLYTLPLIFLVLTAMTVGAQRSGRDSLIRGASAPSYNDSVNPLSRGAKFGYFLKAKKDSPSEQLVYARETLQAGREKAASKAFRALVKIWPETQEAALAQFEYAKLQEILKSPLRAAEAYEYLFIYYTGSFPHDEALQRLFNIGVDLLTSRKAKFLIFPGFLAPERSIPVFENVIQFWPTLAPGLRSSVPHWAGASGQLRL